MTHCEMLSLIANNMWLDIILDCKYIAFYKSIEKSVKKIINYTARIKVYDHTSTLGINIYHLLHKYDIAIDDISLNSEKIKIVTINGYLV